MQVLCSWTHHEMSFDQAGSCSMSLWLVSCPFQKHTGALHSAVDSHLHGCAVLVIAPWVSTWPTSRCGSTAYPETHHTAWARFRSGRLGGTSDRAGAQSRHRHHPGVSVRTGPGSVGFELAQGSRQQGGEQVLQLGQRVSVIVAWQGSPDARHVRQRLEDEYAIRSTSGEETRCSWVAQQEKVTTFRSERCGPNGIAIGMHTI